MNVYNMEKKLVVVDYCMGNLHSVVNALRFLKLDSVISSTAADIERADGIILPGVGAFGEAIANIKKLGLDTILKEQVVHRKKPILGICLGMQLLADSSEEHGQYEGFGFIPGTVEKIETDKDLRLPHMGWNQINVAMKDPLFTNALGDMNFYFVHSYYFNCDKKYVSSTVNYGRDITASVQKDNVFGVQFHPEKSQQSGLRLLRSFGNFVGGK
jgi:glutamine amidotransferase